MSVHEREDDASSEPLAKRVKLDDDMAAASSKEPSALESAPSEPAVEEPARILPPSHSLLGVSTPVTPSEGTAFKLLETDVGISEYIGRGVSQIDGIIKQRFTDFLVFEVDQDSNEIHIKSLAMPESSPKKADVVESDLVADAANPAADVDAMQVDVAQEDTVNEAPVKASGVIQEMPTEGGTEQTEHAPAASVSVDSQSKHKIKETESSHTWAEGFATELSPFLSEVAISQLKQMYLEGPEPPRVSDDGWAGRQAKPITEADEVSSVPAELLPEPDKNGTAKRGRNRGDRGGRGGRGGGRGGPRREDHRKVLSDPIESKATRTALHQKIRELFGGKLDTETDSASVASDDGARIVIKWARRGGGGGRGGRADRGRGERAPRGTYPPYIHFSMQKTNRDTQDALGHLSRILHVNIKDLSVAGTKDKRGVTVQRVSLKRNNKTVEDIWRLGNGVIGKKPADHVLTKRAERGIRIADFNYRKAGLELGMLKGNAFVITLRGVQVDSPETIETALTTLKHHGFINYYGMQRFGTASVPTHSIGLAILKSEWQRAIDMILQKRPGEHPEVTAARDAWLVDKDLDKAISLMPRRAVAERCILESYKKQKGDTRNPMGTLSTIPRNLRLMYVHAYQSYVWNAIVSERIRTYGSDKPVVGDLVLEAAVEAIEADADGQDDDNAAEVDGPGESSRSRKKSRKPYVAPTIKTLTEADLAKYSIFDVVMPLPGTDVAYPGGALGERYREYLTMDGLDPDNWQRKQREYSLFGSYRKILHLPNSLSWSTLRYTDPDVALAQADEDKLLGFDAPAVVEDGRFLALQIKMTLGTAAYATMALREVTKTDTSSHVQSGLTRSSEDQKYRQGEASIDDEQGIKVDEELE